MALRSAWLMVAAMLAAGLSARQQPAFHATTRVVPIYATVVGPDGHLLSQLTRNQFAVFDNGQPREIVSFSNEPIPVTLGGMWDVSLSMTKVEVRERAAARAFVDALWADDRLRFGTFGDIVAWSPLLTSDKKTLRRIVDEEIWFGGATPLWTVIEEGVHRFAGESGRRVLVVLSDGNSRNDTQSKSDALREMQRTDCMVYAVGLAGSGISGSLESVAEESGGGHVELASTADLDREFAEILSELHHQYLIGFLPAALDGESHTLLVRTTVAGAKVRARKSYIAAEVPDR